MATQIQATIYKIGNSRQPSGTVMSFPVEKIMIVQATGGCCIEYKDRKYYSSSSVSDLVDTGLVQATVVQIDGSRQTASLQMAFPADEIEIEPVDGVAGANSSIKFENRAYYVSETSSALNAAANSGSGGSGAFADITGDPEDNAALVTYVQTAFVWDGTQEEYDLLTPDENTTYFIHD